MKKINDTIRQSLYKIKDGLASEQAQTKEMLILYKKYISGKGITPEEMKQANKQLLDLIRASGLTILAILPGSLITIPFLVKIARKYNIELLPDSFLDDENKRDENNG